MIVVVKIAVLPEVKKFLSYRAPGNPFILSKKSKYGMFLYHCLVKINNQVKESSFQVDLNKYSEEFSIRLSEDMWRRKGYYIHPQKQLDFNNFVLMDIDEDFYRHMEFYHGKLGKKIQHSIYDFREKFDLTEDDLTLKCLEKKYERHRLDLTA